MSEDTPEESKVPDFYYIKHDDEPENLRDPGPELWEFLGKTFNGAQGNEN